MQKETLEEAAENYNDKFQENAGSKPPYIKNKHIMNHFMEGAKWQQERMYSEEEVKHIIDKTLIEYSNYVLADIPEWFEQFKKK
jgi:hypothetical protein